MNQKGNALWQLGKLDEAKECFEEAVSIREAYLGSENTMTVTSKKFLARVLESEGTEEALQKAEEILREMLKIRIRIGKESYIAMAYVDLAECMEKKGEYCEAAEYAEKGVEYYSLKNAEGDMIGSERDFCKTFDIYGRNLFRSGRYEEAESILKKALLLQEKHYPAGAANTERMLNSIEEWKKSHE